MSDYVEARYAKLVLREARLAEEDIASKLVNELLHDLGSLRESNAARLSPAISVSGMPQIRLQKLGAKTHFIESSSATLAYARELPTIESQRPRIEEATRRISYCTYCSGSPGEWHVGFGAHRVHAAECRAARHMLRS